LPVDGSSRGDADLVGIYGPGALAASSGGWLRALAEVAAVFVLQLVLFQLTEEIEFTGFLQHHWQDRTTR
jgi:membrane protease YdiL (CAAX protease family)